MAGIRRKLPLFLLSISIIVTFLFVGVPARKTLDHKYIDDLKNPNDQVRLAAMGEIADWGDRIVPELLVALDREEDVLFKMSALEIVGYIKNRSALNSLVQHLHHGDWRVRFAAAAALGHLNTADAIPALKHTVSADENREVRLGALLSLRKIETFDDVDFLSALHQQEKLRGDTAFLRGIEKIKKEVELRRQRTAR